MSQGSKNWEDMAARSNLRISAQEFVPRHQDSEDFNSFHHQRNYPSRPSSSNHSYGSRNRNCNSRQWKNRDRDNFNPSSQSTSRDENDMRVPRRDRDGPSYNYNEKRENSKKLSQLLGKENSDSTYNGARNNYRSKHYNFSETDRGGPNRSYNGNRYRNFDDKTKAGFHGGKDGKNQMEVLIGLLRRGALECLVCCEVVKQAEATWSCKVCHHVFHLSCITKWARSSCAEEGWRCPACQHVSIETPRNYLCFCGKIVDPTWNRNDCPHSCGNVCGLPRPDPCPHKCTLTCHPGPCPPCVLYQDRTCGCGRSSRTVQCTETKPVLCGSPCGRVLNCGAHKCTKECHIGECDPCPEIIKQVCYCSRADRDVPCSKATFGVASFSCGRVCEKKLECGNHECDRICHSGQCSTCTLLPVAVTNCPCGKANLIDLPNSPRTSCLDAIPTCEGVCEKTLPCGEPGNRHKCLNSCHEGACPPCPGETMVRCRCGHMNKALPCPELATTNEVLCGKKCNKKRMCGKHKCHDTCCIDIDHICLLPCKRSLSCGIHRCEAPCHTGYCRPCPRVSFEELLCECGAEVILPPVPCGTRRPTCSNPCSRPHSCHHTPTHSCHSDSDCPPCTVLVSRFCHGEHELRKAIPCHQTEFSCGLPCRKPLACGHTCIKPCHPGPCMEADQICVQPCTVPRPSCGHPCNAPCHQAPCPDLPCKEMVKVTCECGNRFASRYCVDNAREYQRIATAQLASKMSDLAAGQTIDLNDVATTSKKMAFKTLECSEECKLLERNRRLAIGLQIRNPDLTAKLVPNYSESLKSWGKKNPQFCQMVHDKLTELVQLAKESKQKSRSYSFEPMNRSKRDFIHEYCNHFGCESQAYDPEPQRNVVATAYRDRSWLPSLSLLKVMERESGARKIPLPSNTRVAPSQKSMEVLSPRTYSSGTSTSGFNSKTEPSNL